MQLLILSFQTTNIGLVFVDLILLLAEISWTTFHLTPDWSDASWCWLLMLSYSIQSAWCDHQISWSGVPELCKAFIFWGWLYCVLSHWCIIDITQLIHILEFKLFVGLQPKWQFIHNYLSGQYLGFNSKCILSLVVLLGMTVKFSSELTDGLAWLECTFQIIY